MSGGIERQSAKGQITVAMRAFEIVFQGVCEASRVTGAEAITVIDLSPIVLRQIFRHEDLFVLRQLLLGQPVVLQEQRFTSFVVVKSVVSHVYFPPR